MLQVYEDTLQEIVLDLFNEGNTNVNRGIQIVSSVSSIVIITYRDSQFHTNNLLSFLALDMALGNRSMQTMQRMKRFYSKVPQNAHSFVRQTKFEAVYGYLSPTLNGWHGHRQWVFEYWRFSNKGEYKRKVLPNLYTHPGNDIGTSVVFEIFDAKFYVVSNQDTLTSEEANPVSFYYISCYSLDCENIEEPKPWKLWRRNHRDGPIDDNWTNLRLRKDESTGRLIIAETRKEWVERLGKLKRTHYSQDLHNGAIYDVDKDPESGDGSLVHSEVDEQYGTPPPDPIQALKIQLPSVLSRRVPQKLQAPSEKMWHSEYQGDEPPPGYRDFLSSRTRYSAYIRRSAAYLDLVIDEDLWNTLRVRIQSRKKKALPVGSRNASNPLTCHELHAAGNVDDEECYVDSATNLWPPTNAPHKLLKMLNPCSREDRVKFHAASDERSIVYMAEPQCRGSGGMNSIILINFDPSIEFKGLPKLDEEWRPMEGLNHLTPTGQTSSSGTHSNARSRWKPTCRRMEAAWMSIRHGFNLR